MQISRILFLSASLLLMALLSARAHAETRFEIISQLKEWQQSTLQRSDLEEREKDLRVEFQNRLIFQVERKYREDSLEHFISSSLEEMIETDRLQSNQSFGSMSEFLENLQGSFTTLKEKTEDSIDFIQTFTEYSGISDPAPVEEFADSRSYYDGRRMASANPMSLDEAAEIVEAKEKERSDRIQKWIDFRGNLVDEFTQDSMQTDRSLQIQAF